MAKAKKNKIKKAVKKAVKKAIKKVAKKTVKKVGPKKSKIKTIKKVTPSKKKVKIIKKAAVKSKSAKKVSIAKTEKKLKKSPFLKSELNSFKKTLLQIQKKIVGNIQQVEEDALVKKGVSSAAELSDPSDLATDNYDRELNIGIASNQQQLLNDISVALKKIEDDTYGICEVYGTAIPKKRLLAIPYARLSIKAQEEIDKDIRRF